jgi:hypothetical protein
MFPSLDKMADTNNMNRPAAGLFCSMSSDNSTDENAEQATDSDQILL